MTSAAVRRRAPLAPVVLALLAAVLAAEVVAIPLAALHRPEARVPLQVGLAADCLLLCALVVAVAARRAGGLQALGLSRTRVLQLSVLASVVFLAGLRIAGVPIDGTLAAVAVALEVAVITSVILAVRRGLSLERAVTERLPPVVREVLGTEIRLVVSAVSALARRPARRPEGWFSTLERSGSGFIIPVAILLCAVELGAVHSLIAFKWPGAWAAHAVLAALTGYTLVWLVGDRRAMRNTGHRLEGANLILELGARFQAEVPLDQVEKVVRLHGEADLRRVQPRKGQNPRATPFDTPNVHLCFRAPVTARTYFGLRRSVQHLDLYVDEPDAFAAAVSARLDRSLQPLTSA